MALQVQQELFDRRSLDKAVNVASVRKLSPFRYPGGKTWLVPRIRQWLRNPPGRFIEPFAGGGSISLTVAAERLATRVVMAEIDEQVAAVWKAVFLDSDAEWLINRILTFELTPESLETTLASPARSSREKAFQTILKNRTYRGEFSPVGPPR